MKSNYRLHQRYGLPPEYIRFLNPNKIIGTRIRDVRSDRDVTQRELAEAIRRILKAVGATGFPCEQSAVSKIETGLRSVSYLEAGAISEVLCVPFSTFLPWSDGEYDYRMPLDELRIRRIREGRTVSFELQYHPNPKIAMTQNLDLKQVASWMDAQIRAQEQRVREIEEEQAKLRQEKSQVEASLRNYQHSRRALTGLEPGQTEYSTRTESPVYNVDSSPEQWIYYHLRDKGRNVREVISYVLKESNKEMTIDDLVDYIYETTNESERRRARESLGAALRGGVKADLWERVKDGVYRAKS